MGTALHSSRRTTIRVHVTQLNCIMQPLHKRSEAMKVGDKPLRALSIATRGSITIYLYRIPNSFTEERRDARFGFSIVITSLLTNQRSLKWKGFLLKHKGAKPTFRCSRDVLRIGEYFGSDERFYLVLMTSEMDDGMS